MIIRTVAVLLVINHFQQSRGFNLQPSSLARQTTLTGSTQRTAAAIGASKSTVSTRLRVSRSTTTRPSEATASDDEDDNDDDDDIDDEDRPISLIPESSKLPSATPPVSLPTDPVSKFRKLKDIMWIREAVEDVTAAEFACSVEGSSEGEKDASLRRKRKRAVDYEKMLSNLDRRVRDMIPDMKGAAADHEETWTLDPNKGMGRFAYTAEQREELLR